MTQKKRKALIAALVYYLDENRPNEHYDTMMEMLKELRPSPNTHKH